MILVFYHQNLCFNVLLVKGNHIVFLIVKPLSSQLLFIPQALGRTNFKTISKAFYTRCFDVEKEEMAKVS